jgi:hypothetical protein
MIRTRMRRCEGGLVASLPPGKQQPRDNHDQPDLQDQAKQRGKAAHAAKKAMPEQQAEQSRAKESRGKATKQPTPEETGARRRLTNRPGSRRLRERALHGRGRVRRSLCCRRRRERTRSAAAAREPASSARFRIGSNKHQGRSGCGQRHKKAMADHFGLPRQISRAKGMCRSGNL